MAFSDPQKIIDQFEIGEGLQVADLGAGSGFYAIAAAKAVGENGKVYAVDIQQDLLSRIKNMAHKEHIRNIEAVHGDIEHAGGTRMKENTADIAIVANVLFQIEHKEIFITELKRILKSSGRVLIVDWTESFGGLGPHSNAVVTQQDAKELFENNGFSFVNAISAGDHHYGLIFRKK